MLVAIIVPVAFLVATAFAITAVAKVVADSRLRRRLVDAHATSAMAVAILTAPRQDPALYDSLRWGLVTAAVGAALVLAHFLPYASNDPMVYGLVLLFGAGGFLTYYAVARRIAGASGATHIATLTNDVHDTVTREP